MRPPSPMPEALSMYVVIAVLRGQGTKVHPLLYGCAALFVWYFVYGAI
ncbi:MAG: hypothetical protein ACKOSO_03115 [Actinomycetota bacterium]